MVFPNQDGVKLLVEIFEGMLCGKLVLCDRLHKNKKLDELIDWWRYK